MKKFFLLSWAVIAALSFSSCSKDDDGKKDDPKPEPSKEMRYVQSIVYHFPDASASYLNGTNFYEYDDQHRLIKEVFVSESPFTSSYTNTYTYEGNTIKKYDTDGELMKEYQLNDQGYAIAEYYIRDGEKHLSMTYEYDQDGYLKQEFYSDGTIAGTFTQKDGNITSSLRDYWTEENEGIVTQYFYSSTKNLANFNLDDIIGDYLDGGSALPIFGKKNTNLLIGHTLQDCDYGNNYTYDMNENGYVTAVHGTYLGHAYTKTITYYE